MDRRIIVKVIEITTNQQGEAVETEIFNSELWAQLVQSTLSREFRNGGVIDSSAKTWRIRYQQIIKNALPKSMKVSIADPSVDKNVFRNVGAVSEVVRNRDQFLELQLAT